MNKRKLYHKNHGLAGDYAVYMDGECLGYGLTYFEADYAVKIARLALEKCGENVENSFDSMTEIVDN